MAQLVLTAGRTFNSPANQIGGTQSSQQNPDGSLTITKDQNASNVGILSITVTAVHPNQTVPVNYGGTNETVVTTTYDITISTSGGPITGTADLLGTDGTNVLISAPGFPAGGVIVSNQAQSFGFISDTFTPAFTVACYVEGTLIRTASGEEVAIERLRDGDSVVTAFGGKAVAVWVSRRHVDCSHHPHPEMVWPVRVRSGGLGDSLPRRDLWLSPDHAVFIDDVLIPIRHLLNGTSIAQVPVDEVTYCHVELPEHNLILAEGLWAESYLDLGDRSNFTNGDDVVRLFPDFSKRERYTSAAWEAHGCAPLVAAGPKLEAARRRINALVPDRESAMTAKQAGG